MAAPESATSKRKMKGLERERAALELRKAGATYRAIGEALGITPVGAYRAVMRAIAKLNARVLEEAEAVRRLELERLDDLLLAMWPQAKKGNQGAVDRVLRIMERRARLLGIDAPVKQELDVGDALARILEGLAGQSGPGDD